MDYHKNTSGGRVVASSNLVIPTVEHQGVKFKA